MEIVWVIRVVGTLMILAGLWTFVKRPAKYDREGNRGFSGQLTGWTALLAGATNIAIGALLIVNSQGLAEWVTRVIRG